MGAVVGLPSPRSDWNQTDERKADYIKNKPAIVPIEVFNDVFFNQIPDLQENKADKSYVDEKVDAIPTVEQLRQEFEISGINTILSELYFNRVPTLEGNKADKTYVDSAINAAIGEALEGDY